MKTLSGFGLFLALCIGTGAHADEVMSHAGNPAETNSGERQLVNYPDKVKAHVLANMRGHLQTIADIMEALAKAQYNQAADMADMRLGMESTGAAGCRMDGGKGEMGMMSEESHLDHQMSMLMPEGMRKLGQNMHRSANEFAMIARNAANNGNSSAPIQALGNVMKQCAACHAAYRLN